MQWGKVGGSADLSAQIRRTVWRPLGFSPSFASASPCRHVLLAQFKLSNRSYIAPRLLLLLGRSIFPGPVCGPYSRTALLRRISRLDLASARIALKVRRRTFPSCQDDFASLSHSIFAVASQWSYTLLIDISRAKSQGVVSKDALTADPFC